MLKKYGLLGCFKLAVSLLYTWLFYKNVRLIRLPFDVRNRRFINLGTGLTTGFGCRIEALEIHGQEPPQLVLGENVQMNDYVHVACGQSIVINDNVLIASKVFITDINHGQYSGKNSDTPLAIPNERVLSTIPVTIGENVWIGENVCIMPGVTIGFGSIIGAGSVVTKDIAAYSIAVGNPARVIKKYNFNNKQWDLIKNIGD